MWLGIISKPVAPLSFNTIIPPKKYERKQMNRINKITPNAPMVLSKESLLQIFFYLYRGINGSVLYSRKFLKCFDVSVVSSQLMTLLMGHRLTVPSA